MITVWESDISDTFLIPRLNCPIGQVVPQTGPAITKASFQVISIKAFLQDFLDYNH